MFESITAAINLKALVVVLLLAAIGGALLVWVAHKLTGRRIRDLVALIGAGILLVILALSVAIVFRPGLDSPNRETQQMTFQVAKVIFLVFALGIWLGFNHFLRHRKIRKRRAEQINSNS